MEKTYLSLDEEGVPTSSSHGNREGEQKTVGGRVKQKRIEQLKKKNQSTWFYMGAAGEIGFSIALPIAGGAIGGSFLDSQWGTYPKMTLSLLFLGIALSIVNFIFIIKGILEKEK